MRYYLDTLVKSFHKCFVFPIFKQSKYGKIYVNTETIETMYKFSLIIWKTSLSSSCLYLFVGLYYLLYNNTSIINTLAV